MSFWFIRDKSTGHVLDCRPAFHDHQAPLKAVIANHGGTEADYEVGTSSAELPIWQDPGLVLAEKMVAVRERRNQLLAESDVDLLKALEAAMAGQLPAALVQYRQALRDIPQTYASDPDQVVWPKEPA